MSALLLLFFALRSYLGASPRDVKAYKQANVCGKHTSLPFKGSSRQL